MGLNRLFLNLSITKKIVVLFYCAVLFIMLVLFLVLLIISEKNAVTEMTRSGIALVEDGIGMIEKEQSYLYGFAEHYAMTDEVQGMLTGIGNDSAAALRPDLILSKKHMTSLAFFDLSGAPVGATTIDGSHTPISQAPSGRPFHELIGEHATFVWEFIPKDSDLLFEWDTTPKLCLWYTVRHNSDRQPIGVIAISVDVRNLFYTGTETGRLYNSLILLNADGQIAFNRTEATLGPEDQARLLAQGNGGVVTMEDGKSYYAFSSPVTACSMLVALLVEKPLIALGMSSLALYILVAVLICLALLFPMLYFVSNQLTRPLKKLASNMQRFSAGDFSVRLSFNYADEVGQLGQIFNQMVEENRKLIERNYILKIREREAQLSALQVQMNPHYSLNLINSIQWLALKKGETETADLIYTMGRTIRANLRNRDIHYTLDGERELLEDYLKLQRRLNGDRLEYKLDFSPEAGCVQVPRFFLQPLVENSINHGLRESEQILHINVTAHVRQGWLHCVVSDDGAGIPTDILQSLLAQDDRLSDDRHTRLALRNIHERLRIIYGPEYSIAISSTPFAETRFEITIPTQWPEGLPPDNGTPTIAGGDDIGV